MSRGRAWWAALILISACGPSIPPVLRPAAVMPPPIPTVATLDDPALFGYLKARDPLKLAGRLGAGQQVGVARSMGLDVDGLRPGAAAAVFLWTPEVDEIERLPAVAVLPTPVSGSLASSLTAMVGEARITGVGDDTVIAMSPDGMMHARRSGEALTRLVQAPMIGDVLLQLHVEPIMRRYGGMVRDLARAAQKGIEAADRRKMQGINPGFMKDFTDGLLRAIESLDSIAIGLALEDEFAEAFTIVRDRAAATATGPAPAHGLPDLSTFLPPGDIRVLMRGASTKGLMDFYLDLFGALFDQSSPTWKRFSALFREWGELSVRTDFAMNFSFDDERGFRGSALMLTEDAKRWMELAQEMISLVQDPSFQDLYRKQGIEFAMAVSPEVRKLHGWPVDRYDYRIKTTGRAAAQKEAQQILDRLGHFQLDLVRMGSYVIYQINGNDAELDGIAEELLRGKGTQRPLDAVAAFPAGGHLYAEVDVQHLWSAFKEMMPVKAGRRMPTLEGSIPAVTMAGYKDGAASYYRVQVPNALIDAVKKASDDKKRRRAAPARRGAASRRSRPAGRGRAGWRLLSRDRGTPQRSRRTNARPSDETATSSRTRRR